MADGATHFSMIGYDLDMSSDAAFETAITEVAEYCTFMDFKKPYRLCLVSDGGQGEIWLGFVEKDERLEIVTVNPAYHGIGRMPVSVNGFASDPDWEPFEYQLSVTFSDLEIPLLVDMADPRQKDQIAAGSSVTLDVIAFTYEPEIFKDSAAYQKAQAKKDPQVQFADNHFIPSGLFGPEPSAHALFAGKVLEAELKSGQDGARYWEALVSTLDGATVTVVFDDISTTVDPEPGNLLAGEFWLSGRLAPEDN